MEILMNYDFLLLYCKRYPDNTAYYTRTQDTNQRRYKYHEIMNNIIIPHFYNSILIGYKSVTCHETTLILFQL